MDARGQLKIGGGSLEHGRRITVQRNGFEKSKLFVKVPETSRVTSELYHTSRNKRQSFSQNDDVYLINRSVSVVVQESEKQNDADRLIKVCQM